ncbi:MAG TPA: hypothetical protein PLR07_05440 [Promineifilum sp.]|nr:hypothetical protein [Promineifilum sp.]
MNVDYLVLAARIPQELAELNQVISRAERGNIAAKQHAEDSDLYIDAVALNLHDFYTGLERIFRQIVTTVDRSMPASEAWHRDLLRQMCVELPGIRPRVLTEVTCTALDDFLRFRHVVRNVFAFQLDGDRVGHLTLEARTVFDQLYSELMMFVIFLEQSGQDTTS